MKLIILSFIISISLHFFFFKNYKIDYKQIAKITKEKKISKATINYVKIKKQTPKSIVKKIIKKPVVKKKIKPKYKSKKFTKKSKKIIKKFTKNKKTKIIKKAKVFQNKVLKEQVVKNKKTIQEKTLENFLSQKEPTNKKILSKLKRLYGREYETFTKIQKAFLQKNLSNFQIITQRVLNRLGYPPIASKMKLSGRNTVEFLFHPNGNMSKLKITNSSGYEIFDEYTLELIRIAYKDYPKPKTTTKLKFNVFYRAY